MLGPSGHRYRLRRLLAVLAVAPLVLTTACTKAAPEPPPILNQYLTGVQVLGQDATDTVVNKVLDAGADNGPAATVPEQTTVVNGGSVEEPITSTTPFSKLRIGLEPLVSPSASASTSPAASPSPAARPSPATVPAGTAPAKGYHEITLKKADTKVRVVISIAQALPATLFNFYFAVVDDSGKQGKLRKQAVEAIQVGTGEVQVSISWDVDSDVDLHVADPAGDEVYWYNDSVESGGQLDLDSNANCDIDHKRNENITWNSAPGGVYTVRVDLYKSCGVTRTNYVVTVRVNGQQTKVFTGSLDGDGDEGDVGAGTEITKFTVVAASPQPSASH